MSAPKRRAIGRGAAVATFAAALFGVSNAHATDDPSLTWWTYETDHFKVTYPDNIEPVAYRVAQLSESIYARLTPEIQYAPDAKTEIVLTDDTDSANGSANPIPYDTIRLYVTAPDDVSTLSDYDDWYLGLITHEYTHILHTGNISGLAAVANRVIGRTLAPNSAQPRWVIEGLAVLFESDYTAGGRIRSSLFDAYLRADVLEDNLATLAQISSGADRWPYGNLYYLYGSRFMRWIADVYGPDVFPAISADYGASTAPFGINRALRRVTGTTYEDLYDAWGEHLKRHYKAQVDAADRLGRREGVRITHHGHNASYPRFVPKAYTEKPGEDEVVYYRDDFHDRSGIHRFTLGSVEDTSDRDAKLFVRTATDAATSFAPDGQFLLNDVAFFKNIYARNDLFSVDAGADSSFGTEVSRRRLTHGLRALNPDVSPDGKLVTFTANSAGTTTLMVADRDRDGRLSSERVLVPSKRWDQAYSPRFSPDGSHVVYSAWLAGGYRDIRLVEVATGKVRDLTHDRSLDVQPTWAPDGKTVFWSSDRTGIFNVYAMDLESGGVKLVTNVHGLALSPAISPDGTKLVYVGYTHEGFDLFAMKLDPERWLAAPAAPDDRPAPVAEPPAARIERSRYNPLPTLRPQTYFLDVGPGSYGSTAFTLSASGSDLVGHHSLNLSLRVEPGAPEPRFDLSYGYGGLPVNLSASFTRATVRRTQGYSLGVGDVPYDEHNTAFSTGVTLPLLDTYVSQSFGLGYTASGYSAELEQPETLDPFGEVPEKPDAGFLSQLRLSYSLSTIEGSSHAAGGSVRGVSLGLSTTLADQNTGSDASFYAFDADARAYVPMPWPGEQTLALRTSLGLSGGDYTRRGTYFIGGYDLENNTPFDTLIGGVYDGAFMLRGYIPSASYGQQYLLSSAEYRAPIYSPNWGPSTVPIFLRRIDASAFADWGGAFDRFDFAKAGFFKRMRPIFSEQLHTSVGAEIWLGLTVAYRIATNVRVGYAYGFDPGAYPDGQLYFVSTSAF